MVFERMKTDIYPIRYMSADNPGKWVVFEPVDGMYRPSREDATPMPVRSLCVGVSYPGELAMIYVPAKDGSDGVHIEIGGGEKPFWGTNGPKRGYRAVCRVNPADPKARPYDDHLFAETLEEAISLAEQRWLTSE